MEFTLYIMLTLNSTCLFCLLDPTPTSSPILFSLLTTLCWLFISSPIPSSPQLPYPQMCPCEVVFPFHINKSTDTAIVQILLMQAFLGKTVSQPTSGIPTGGTVEPLPGSLTRKDCGSWPPLEVSVFCTPIVFKMH